MVTKVLKDVSFVDTQIDKIDMSDSSLIGTDFTGAEVSMLHISGVKDNEIDLSVAKKVSNISR